MPGATTMATTNAAELVIPTFHDVLGDIFAHGHTHYWLHGGRGSTKSSFISLAIVLLVVHFPYANAVVVRRFGNTLRVGTFRAAPSHLRGAQREQEDACGDGVDPSRHDDLRRR